MKIWTRRWILCSAMAAITLLGVATVQVRADEKNEKDEVKVKIDEVPAAVKSTLLKETGDGKIAEIEKETKKGKTIYSADATIGANKYEIEVSEDGTLISKKLDNDDDEKDKTEKDGEK
jgi:hypothetical protein